MARTSHSNTNNAGSSTYPGLWIQYKGSRARTLQTARSEAERSRLTSGILDEFQADLKALAIAVPAPSIDDVRIIWGTGQIRSTFSLLDTALRYYLKYTVRRTSTDSRYLEMLSERSIAHILYTEGGTALPTDALPTVAPWVAFPRPSASPAKKVFHMSLDSEPLAVSSRTESGTSFPHLPSLPPGSSYGSSNTETPGDRKPPTINANPTIPASATSSALLKLSWPPAPHSPTMPHVAQAPQILHPLSFSKDWEGATKRHGPAQAAPRISPGSPSKLQEHVSQASPPSARVHETQSVVRDMGRLRPPLPPVALTAGACARIRDRTNEAVLSTCPVLQVLVLRRNDRVRADKVLRAYDAFVTDGEGYAWVAFSSTLTEQIGNRDNRAHLQVGSAARLKRMSRLPASESCSLSVHEFELVEGLPDATRRSDIDASDLPSPSITFGTAATIRHESGSAELVHVHKERAARLLADMKFQEERRRRITLERALADVCHDLDRRDTLAPAAVEALRKIDELANVAMLMD